MAERRFRFKSGDIAAGAVLAFFALLPHVFSLTALENFRIPKDAFATAFIVVLAAFFLLTQPFWPRRRPQAVALLLAAGLAYLFGHTLWLGRPEVSWPAFRQVFLFSALWLMLVRLMDDKWQARIWLSLAASMGLNAVIAILQTLGYFPLMERQGGILLRGRLIPAGMIGDVNSGGFLFALVILYAVFFVVFERRLRFRLVWAGLLLLNTAGLLATRTLTAVGVLSLCLGLGILFHHWWVLSHRAGRLQLVRLWLILVPALVAVAAASYQFGVFVRLDRVAKSISIGNWTTALSGRAPAFQITWEMIKDNPVWGRGLDTFSQDFFFARVDTEFGQQLMTRGPGAFRQVHNEYLQTWAELGIVALLLLLLLWLIPLVRSARRIPEFKDQDRAYWQLVNCLAGLFVLVSCITFFPFHVSSTAAASVLVLAGLVRLSFRQEFEGRTLTDLLANRPALLWGARSALVTAAVVLLTFPVGTWRANRELGISAFLLKEARASEPRRLRVLADEAASRLDRAHRLAPQIREYWNMRGTASLLLGRYAEARRYYERAAHQLPSPEVFTNLAVACIGRRDYAAARKHLQTALRYNPRYETARKALKSLENRASGSTR